MTSLFTYAEAIIVFVAMVITVYAAALAAARDGTPWRGILRGSAVALWFVVLYEAARIGASIVWFQPGAEHPPSEARARELGLEVISGKCTMAEHRRLFA